MTSLTLKPGREKSLLRRHPWIFSGAVEKMDGNPVSGETVDIVDSRGSFLARAAYSPNSQIRARAWTFDPTETVDAEFFRRRIQASIGVRETLRIFEESNAFRLVHAESDGLPGLIVDRYNDLLVIQCLSAGIEFWRETITKVLPDLTGAKTIFERSDADVRELEGLPSRTGLLLGSCTSDQVEFTENELKFLVDITKGHKTGFYLDQRANRLMVRKISADREVLDCFCYTGGFTVNALAGRAKTVLSVDSSKEALSVCEENVARNGFTGPRHMIQEGDVFTLLRKFRDEDRHFDMVILDPPKFAPTTAQVEKASRGYKDINLLGIKLLRPGGLLVTFSCSGGVDMALFQKIVASAAVDTAADLRIVEYLNQGPDHPVAANFPEGAYLKGLVCIKK